jgi:hypothetical protein
MKGFKRFEKIFKNSKQIKMFKSNLIRKKIHFFNFFDLNKIKLKKGRSFKKDLFLNKIKEINLSKTFKITTFSTAITFFAGQTLIMKEEDKKESPYTYSPNKQNNSTSENEKKEIPFLLKYFKMVTRMLNTIKNKVANLFESKDVRPFPKMAMPENKDLIIPPTLVFDLSAIISILLDSETSTPLKRPGLDLLFLKLQKRYEIVLIDDTCTTEYGSTTIER